MTAVQNKRTLFVSSMAWPRFGLVGIFTDGFINSFYLNSNRDEIDETKPISNYTLKGTNG